MCLCMSCSDSYSALSIKKFKSTSFSYSSFLSLFWMTNVQALLRTPTYTKWMNREKCTVNSLAIHVFSPVNSHPFYFLSGWQVPLDYNFFRQFFAIITFYWMQFHRIWIDTLFEQMNKSKCNKIRVKKNTMMENNFSLHIVDSVVWTNARKCMKIVFYSIILHHIKRQQLRLSYNCNWDFPTFFPLIARYTPTKSV